MRDGNIIFSGTDEACDVRAGPHIQKFLRGH